LARQRLLVVVDHIDHVSGGYEPQLRAAFDSCCQKHDLDLVLLVGSALEDPNPVGAAHSRVYELLDRTSADGVIIMASGLTAYTGAERLPGLHAQLGGIPVCSVGCAVPGMPSVVVDNRPGMAELVEHVIGVHGRRRLAFITGPPRSPDGEARLAVYREVLERHGIPVDPRLIAQGFFDSPSGARAALELLSVGVPFDALIVCNDAMALSAVEALRGRGVRIPRDVVVTGFDDLVLSRLATPPLTTVRQPLERMGVTAVGLILDQLAGRPVPELIELPVEFVARGSCGCDERGNLREARASGRVAPPSSEAPIARVRAASNLESGGEPPRWLARLVEAIEVELSGTSGEFLDALEDMLEQAVDGQDALERLQRWVLRLRREGMGPALDRIWEPAERMIEAAMTRSEARLRLTADVVFQDLLRAGERLSTASLDEAMLRRVIAEEFSQLRIRNACISLYSSPDRKKLTPFLWLSEGKVQALDAPDYPAASLLPPSDAERRRTYCILPLTYESEQLGLAGFELSAGIIVFPMLAGQVSAALKNVALHQEIVHTTTLHERSVHDRLATAERMASLSVLAGGVAHDLNNALGPLVTLPDVILTELDELKAGTLTDDSELRLDVATIKSSALRAAQTIKDLMLLGRPGATAKQALDLNEVVSSAMGPESLRFLAPRAQSVRVQLELAVEPLTVLASEPHLVRAIGNLVRNGSEAIVGSGQINVRTGSVRLEILLGAYEMIPSGDYATVTVSDSGAGIDPVDLARIFEPFFSRKRLADSSGSGLGLAIVHGVVKEHGGYVDVVSTIGQGTTFTLYFPRATGRPISERAVAPAPGGSARILIVDDEPIQLQAARRVLRHLGYQVDTTQSGAEALARFATEHRRRAGGNESIPPPDLPPPYDLVIVDYALNEKQTGLETLQRIRAMFPSQRGIMVSGHGRAELEGYGLAVPWLAKPYSAEALARMVKRTLDSNPPPSSDRGPT
jgi:DNA-binding LacI/PurR family transcriptional regulator/C4-dicarboxylate-specific signal transduction histidine kinase/ActR/RegA family two-component response regulator